MKLSRRPLPLDLGTDEVVSRRIERLLEKRGDVERIALGGSPNVPLPAHVVEAAAAAAGREGYAPSAGEPELREAIAATLSPEGIATDPDSVLVTNGAMQALEISFRVLLEAGESVLIAQPGFFIGGQVRQAGGRLIGFPSPERDAFRPDWEAAEHAVDRGTRVLFLNTPVNPTGYVFRAEDIEAALELAERHDLTIVSDESYSRFVYGGLSHLSVASYPEARERTILIRSFSKDYAMAGWRLGYAVLPPRLVDAVIRSFEWSCLCVSRIVQATGLAALTGPGSWMEGFVRDGERRAGLVADGLNRIPGIRCTQPEGGLNALVGFDGDASALVSQLVFERNVPVHPGEAFGAPGYLRFQFGADEATLRAAIDRVEQTVETMQNQEPERS